jgi:hypothetical protein
MPALVSVEICVSNVYVNVLTLWACEGPIFNTVPIHFLEVADAAVEFLAETQRADSFGVTQGISKVTSRPAVAWSQGCDLGYRLGCSA